MPTDEAATVNYSVAFKPNLWQRIAWWHRWPWVVKMVDPTRLGEQPYRVIVRKNGVMIGWHPIDSTEATTTFIVPGRWTCLAGVIKPPRFEVEIGHDHHWRAPQEDAS